MDKSQAESVAQAILEPDLHEQANARRKLQAKADRMAAHRRQTVHFIAGYVVGAAIGYFATGRFASYGLVGGFAGILVGAIVRRVRSGGARQA